MMKSKMMFVKFGFVCFLGLTTISHAYSCFKMCISSPCDNILKDVMGKQRDTLEARLDDLIDTIKANTKQTKYQTKIIKREVIVYKALLKRIEKESLSLKEASYLSKKIKDSEALGGTIDITRKGK